MEYSGDAGKGDQTPKSTVVPVVVILFCGCQSVLYVLFPGVISANCAGQSPDCLIISKIDLPNSSEVTQDIQEGLTKGKIQRVQRVKQCVISTYKETGEY